MLQIAKYARRIAFFLCLCSHICSLFSPFVLGICSFSSVMTDECLVSCNNVLQVCHCFSDTLSKKRCIQICRLLLLKDSWGPVTLCVITSGPFVAPRQFVRSHSATHHQNNNGPVVRKKTFFITFDTQLPTSRRIAHFFHLSFNVEKKQRDLKSKTKAKNKKKETQFPQHDEFLFSSPSVVL